MKDLGKKVIPEKFSGLKDPDIFNSKPQLHKKPKQKDWTSSKLKLFILQKDKEETVGEKMCLKLESKQHQQKMKRDINIVTKNGENSKSC